jgi:hypothetical protein
MKTPYSTLLKQALVVSFISVLPAAYGQLSKGDFKAEPDKTLASAHESFVKGETQKAGDEIDKAGDYLKKESRDVSEASKADMDKAGDDLKKLGGDVKSGAVKSDDDLKKAFAKTDHETAKAWHETADEARKAGKDSLADLKKAGNSLEGAAKWSGHEVDDGTQKTLDAVKHAGKASADQADEWWNGIGHGIDDLGHKL